MTGLALLGLLQAGPYDPDPSHLWNRIHVAIHGWHVRHLGPEKDLDSIHWPATPGDISGESQMRLLPLLEEFLSKRGDDLVRESLRRAVLQRDLWMVFAWSVATEADVEEADRPGHRELRKRLAAAMRRIAPTFEQVRALPDAYAAAAAKHPALPADLLDPKGPWVVLGDASGDPLARAHLEFFRGRADFTIHFALPAGRKATEDYVRRLGAREVPECPDGTRVALVRRAQLVTDRGFAVSSPIVESVQLRILRAGREAESVKFQLRREKLFAGEAGGLRPVGPDDRDSLFVLSLGHNKDDGRARVLANCVQCHAGSSITSLEIVSPVRRKGRPSLVPTSLEDETFATGRWTADRFSFGLLKALWPD